jgi:negative regulator of replication initiation
MAENNSIQESMTAILRQMQDLISLCAACEKMAKEANVVVQAIATVWAKDIERVLDEHKEDIDALKNSQEYVGRSIAAVRKDIDLIKTKIG